MATGTNPKLVLINTHPITTHAFLKGQMAYMSHHGMEVVAVSSPGPELDGLAESEGVTIRTVPMHREIRPWHDLIALFRMCRLLRKLRPHIVHVGTPKASLLGMMAATVVGVPVRIYLVRGLRLESTRGLKRWVLSAAERITSACAHLVMCESASLQDVFLDLKLGAPSKTMVLGPGMLNGLDYDRYGLEAHRSEDVDQLRQQLKIPVDAPVIGFVGRFVRDKGIVELCMAFESVLDRFPTARLLLIGDFESGDPIPDEVAQQIHQHPQIVLAGYVTDVAPYYPLMHVHVLPSYREGFPNSPMEAAACEVPTVGFRATGTVDAIVEGVTGAIVPCGDHAALASAMICYLADPELRRDHGKAARERVKRDFRREPHWDALFQKYFELLKERGLPVPTADGAKQNTMVANL